MNKKKNTEHFFFFFFARQRRRRRRRRENNSCFVSRRAAFFECLDAIFFCLPRTSTCRPRRSRPLSNAREKVREWLFFLSALRSIDIAMPFFFFSLNRLVSSFFFALSPGTARTSQCFPVYTELRQEAHSRTSIICLTVVRKNDAPKTNKNNQHIHFLRSSF